MPLEDRIQAGTLALAVAIERFDPARGTRLTTYLGPVVERAIRRLGGGRRERGWELPAFCG